MAIPLTNITVPTPEPYSKNDPSRNQENLAYVQLQIYEAAKTAGESVSFNPSTSLSVDLAELIAAIEALQHNGQVFDFGQFRIFFDGKTATIT